MIWKARKKGSKCFPYVHYKHSSHRLPTICQKQLERNGGTDLFHDFKVGVKNICSLHLRKYPFWSLNSLRRESNFCVLPFGSFVMGAMEAATLAAWASNDGYDKLSGQRSL